MSKQIVLITGAGSSNALNPQFALGAELLKQISERVTDKNSRHAPFLSNLLKTKFEYSILWEFVHHLDEYIKNVDSPSIDGFLDEVSTYPEFNNFKDQFIQIAKFSIVFHILGYEAELDRQGLKEDAWINEVAKFIDEKGLINGPNSEGYDLKLITFNYDRNIEHLLMNHMRFQGHRKEIGSFIQRSVIHVYGKVNDLEWQNSSNFFEFGEDNSQVEKIYSKKNSIEIMYSERLNFLRDSEKVASNWIHSSATDKVCAFGFNFDLINYRMLSLENLGVVNPKLRFIANVYPYDSNEFVNRRTMANRIRNIKHDVELKYFDCTEFLKTVLC